MDKHIATELAYKNGYAKGIGDFVEKLNSKLENNIDISAVGYQSVIYDIITLAKEMVDENNEK